jgi:hypothetical protein
MAIFLQPVYQIRQEHTYLPTILAEGVLVSFHINPPESKKYNI